MTHPAHLKAEARELRAERRLTIDEIAERLALSRTTVHHWVGDLPLERTIRQSEAQRRGTAAMRERAAERRGGLPPGAEEFEELRREPTFEHFVCLYLAEGSKRNRNAVALGTLRDGRMDGVLVLHVDRCGRTGGD